MRVAVVGAGASALLWLNGCAGAMTSRLSIGFRPRAGCCRMTSLRRRARAACVAGGTRFALGTTALRWEGKRCCWPGQKVSVGLRRTTWSTPAVCDPTAAEVGLADQPGRGALGHGGGPLG